MPEMGIRDSARVVAIRANQVDTRLWNEERDGDCVSRPITGKFQYASDDVYDLYFDSDTTGMGVTGGHLFWSLDRSDWVGAKFLHVGEKIKCIDGSRKLIRRSKREGTHHVYNLEVYKDHTYFVSMAKVLVHNTCIGDRTVGDIVKLPKLRPIQKGVHKETVQRLADEMEHMVKETGRVDWALLQKRSTRDNTPIIIAVYKDGTRQIQNGTHRIAAAQLAGVKIPWENPNVVLIVRGTGEKMIDYNWSDLKWDEK